MKPAAHFLEYKTDKHMKIFVNNQLTNLTNKLFITVKFVKTKIFSFKMNKA